jgi:signal transduction histidine kinase
MGGSAKTILKKLYATMLVFFITLAGIMTAFIFSCFVFPNMNLPFWLPKMRDSRVVLTHSIGFIMLCMILIVMLLITIRKADEDRAYHNEFFRLYRSVFSNINTGLLVFDSNRRLSYLNDAARIMIHHDVDMELSGISIDDIVDPLLVPVFERISTAMDNGENFSREYRVFLPDGVRCVKCDFYTVSEDGLERIFFMSLTDKTDEDAIRQKLSIQLEETHRYVTAKDNFFANMSHEIRTPINAILGMTYFVKNLTTEQKCLEYIQKIESSSEILLGVVNDILDFSKMQGNKFTLKPENFNLSDIRKILFDLFGLKAEQKDLELDIQFDCPEFFFVYGDQFRLTQVFMNLVSNAIKFTDRGFISVSLNHEIIGNEIIIRCTVRDTGVGLSEDDIARLFTDFEQFGKVLVKNHEGTGLGLAISKRLVELMHGVIWVDSTLGKGSSFHFVVVLKKPESTFIQTFPSDLPRIVRKTNRVLLVEDNEINTEIAESLLGELGLSVDHAGDGLSAIDLCRSHEPDYYDLILMDIHMPRMNGYDAARVLKKEMSLSCPILAVTATSENNDTLEANKDVISGAILKPYSPGVFRILFDSEVT